MEIKKVWFDEQNIYVVLDTGHTVGNPLCWFPSLQKATPEQRNHFKIDQFGEGINWEELDEDLSLEGFLTYKWKDELAIQEI